jgi:hypothetical protein
MISSLGGQFSDILAYSPEKAEGGRGMAVGSNPTKSDQIAPLKSIHLTFIPLTAPVLRQGEAIVPQRFTKPFPIVSVNFRNSLAAYHAETNCGRRKPNVASLGERGRPARRVRRLAEHSTIVPLGETC